MGLLARDDGVVQQTDQEAPQLEAAGYVRCYTNNWRKATGDQGQPINVPCPFWISPEGQTHITNQMGGYFTCPICQRSYDLMHDLPWHGVEPSEAESNQREDQQAHNWTAGGGTRVGLKMAEQAQIGENLVEHLGSLGQYGPITWWHSGGATANSPLDGATQDWGVEVKTLGYDTMHHRFVPGGVRKNGDGTTYDERAEKNEQAESMGKKGVLGVLVLLDYRRSIADIYVKEMPLGPRQTDSGQTIQGVTTFRSSSGEKLVAEVPFSNPLLDPHSLAPHVETGKSAFEEPEEAAAF